MVKLSFFFLLLTFRVYAIEVAMFKMYRPNGELVIFEEGGQYSHTAVLTTEGWLNAHPIRGVELTASIQDIGLWKYTADIYSDSRVATPEIDAVLRFLYLPYDSEFLWDDHKMYCSELLAKIIGVKPRPMRFDPRYWGPQHQQYTGLPGVSPDGLAEELKNRGYRLVRSFSNF